MNRCHVTHFDITIKNREIIPFIDNFWWKVITFFGYWPKLSQFRPEKMRTANNTKIILLIKTFVKQKKKTWILTSI